MMKKTASVAENNFKVSILSLSIPMVYFHFFSHILSRTYMCTVHTVHNNVRIYVCCVDSICEHVKSEKKTNSCILFIMRLLLSATYKQESCYQFISLMQSHIFLLLIIYSHDFIFVLKILFIFSHFISS